MPKSDKLPPEQRSADEEALLARAEASIVSDPGVLGGEPAYVGNWHPSANVAASVRAGIDLEQLQEAYRFLTPELIEDAETYQRVHPKVERVHDDSDGEAPISRRKLISREVVGQAEIVARARDAVERGIREGGGFTPEEVLKRMDDRIEIALLARKPRDS
jgi:uncharacterized protein (DUF433 family)